MAHLLNQKKAPFCCRPICAKWLMVVFAGSDSNRNVVAPVTSIVRAVTRMVASVSTKSPANCPVLFENAGIIR